MQITITEALNKLKVLDARIYKEITSASFVSAAKKKDTKVGVVTKEAFSEAALASKQSIADLIANRARLKAAIVASNAVTKVKVGDREMTGAEAIEYKASIEYEKSLYEKLTNQLAQATSTVTSRNAQVDAQIDKLLEAAYGKDDTKKTAEIYDSIAKPYHLANDWELVDPIGAAKVMAELSARITDFETHVDTALSVSNATTVIEY